MDVWLGSSNARAQGVKETIIFHLNRLILANVGNPDMWKSVVMR